MDKKFFEEKEIAKFMGYLSNSNISSIDDVLDVWGNINEFKKYTHYNIPNRIYSSILMRPREKKKIKKMKMNWRLKIWH